MRVSHIEGTDPLDSLEPRPWNPARQCTATNREGARCQRQPIPGGDVCVMHGGRAPQVRRAASLRILAICEPVLDVFEEIVATFRGTRCTGCGHVDVNGVKCVGCGKPTGDPKPIIDLGTKMLDRAGLGPSATVHIAPASDTSDYTAWMPRERLLLIGDWITEARAAMHRGEPRAADDPMPMVDVRLIPLDGSVDMGQSPNGSDQSIRQADTEQQVTGYDDQEGERDEGGGLNDVRRIHEPANSN
jgi:hypothetical protein